jgi:phosphatidate cytidylyltransferase
MLKTRIITAIVLTISFLTLLFLATPMIWALTTLAVTLIAVWEWSNLIMLSRTQMLLNMLLGLCIGLTFIFSASMQLTAVHDVLMFELLFGLFGIAVLFWLFLAPVWLVTRRKINNKLMMAALGLLLLLANWVALVGLHRISPWLLLSVLATVWLADSAAYFAGKRFGHNKLAPEISPGKTWEGVAGAFVGVMIYGVLLCYYLHLSPWLIVGLWLVVVLSIMGDLFESLLKRQAGVKDSSQLLPGHGGILDRIDGLIPSLPLALFFLLLLKYFHISFIA